MSRIPPAPVPLRVVPPGRERGVALLATLVLGILLASISFHMYQQAMTGHAEVLREETTLRAEALAEIGIARAEIELLAGVDAESDGLGTVSGTLGGGAYEVAATQDAGDAALYVLRSTGTHGLSTRTLEVGVRVGASSPFTYALFTDNDLSIDSSMQTDSFDSRDGSYASQAVNSDGSGDYADENGHIGSNQDVTINSSVHIRGDIDSGPFGTIDIIGSSVHVNGNQRQISSERTLTPTPYEEFEAALADNDNGSMIRRGDEANYDPVTMSLNVDSSSEVELPEGTYLFTDFVFNGPSRLLVQGPVTIYITGRILLTSSTWINVPGVASDLVIHAHPYVLPIPYVPNASDEIELNSSLEAAFALYAPGRDLYMDSSVDIQGAIVADRGRIDSSVYIHYDEALADLDWGGGTGIERIYWRDVNGRW